MKNLIILIFILSFFVVSCENDTGDLIISASVPIKTLNETDTPNAISNSFYVPSNLLEYLKDNMILTLHILSPGQEEKQIDIDNPIITWENSILGVSFDTLLEEGKKKILLVNMGIKNEGKEGAILDADTSKLFIGGVSTDIQKGKEINSIEMQAIFNFSGSIFDENNANVVADLDIYPAVINSDDPNKESYLLKSTKTTNNNGDFDITTVYGVFKDINKTAKELFNLAVIAKSKDGSLGFTIVSKEYKEYDYLSNIDSEKLNTEYTCYKYFPLESCNKSIDILNMTTQSGNLLPGIKLKTNIKVYNLEKINMNASLISSINTPKFAKIVSPDGDTMNKAYYGNFFITGFNLEKLFTSPINREGAIRIYYDYSEIKEVLINTLGAEGIESVYLEYVGTFASYTLNSEKNNLPLNLSVIQNRLPFFKIYINFNDVTGKLISKELSIDPKLNDYLIPQDGLNNGSFLGVNDLKKLITTNKIIEVKFTQDLKDIEGSLETIYENE
jgi:hypothetical protein